MKVESRRARSIAMTLLLVGITSPVIHVAHASETITPPPSGSSLTQLSEYYHHVTSGGIKADQLATAEFQKITPLPYFDLVSTWSGRWFENQEYQATSNLNLAALQSLFYVDVQAFTKSFGAQDFLEAKRIQYQSQNFDFKLAQHQQPYPSLESWGTLAHPPIKNLTLPIEQYNHDFAPINRRAIESPYFTKEFQEDLDEVTGTELTQGNQLLLLPNSLAYDEKLKLVKAATKSIWMASMAIDCSKSSLVLINLLKDKMDQGVDVKILTEYMYAKVIPGTSPCYRRMKRMGLPITIINEHFRKGGKFAAVFHDKFWIFDEKAAIVGGQNIIDMNNEATGFNKHFRDGDVEVMGPAVTDYRLEFLKIMERHYKGDGFDHLLQLKDEIEEQKAKERAIGIRGLDHYEEWFKNPDKRLNGVCRSIVQKSRGIEQSHAEVFKRYLAGATEMVWLSSPKLSNHSKKELNLIPYLIETANRGVTINILSNGIDGGDADFTLQVEEWAHHFSLKGKWRLAALIDHFRKWDQKRSAKVKIKPLAELAQFDHFRSSTYFQFIHEKKWQFDRLAVYIGSFNFDDPSTHDNHEAGILCMDESLLDQDERQFTIDAINSTPLMFKQERAETAVDINEDLEDEPVTSIDTE